MLDDILDRLVERGGYPQLSRTGPDRWMCHIGFGNERVGVVGHGSTPQEATLAAEQIALETTEPRMGEHVVGEPAAISETFVREG
jgi:hypothetical protein